MRKFFISFALIAAVAVSFVSCTKEIDHPEESSAPMKTIKVITDIATKTTLDANHQNIVWSTGDKISIFNDVDNTNEEVAYAVGGDIEVEVPAATTAIYAHYPYFSGNTNGPEFASVYISNNQTQENPGSLNGYYFPMVAKGIVSDDNKALISFYPVAGALALNIYKSTLDGTETVESVKVTPASTNTGFYGSQTTNITGNDVEYTSAAGTDDAVTVTLTNGLSLASSAPSNKQTFDGQIYVCLAKQSYAGVKFEIKTDKGTYTITSNSTAAFDLENNDFVPVNINLAKATFDEKPTAVDPTTFFWGLVKDGLTVGDKVVIAAAESAVAMSTTQNNNNRGQIAITKSGTSLTAVTDVQVFEVVTGSKDDAIALKCLNGSEIGKYISAASSSSNNMHSIDAINDNSSWSITINETTGVASVTAQGTYTRNILKYNSSNSVFSCYGSTNTMADVVFYRTCLPSANLSFPEDSYSVNIGEAFTAPALTNPYNVLVTYSSNDSEVAAVDASSGTVTIGSTAGIATITATFAGNDSYSATEASYSIEVIDPTLEKGATWTYTFNEKQWTKAGAITLNNRTWTMAGVGGSYFAYDATKGQQFGSGSAPYSAITLSSNFGNAYGIESIAINTSGASSINATVSVSVNGVAFKCGESETASLTATATTYTFNSPSGLKAGDILISFANNSSKAIYVKSITLNPEGTVVDPIKLVMSNISCTDSGTNENSLSFTWSSVEHAIGYKVSIDNGTTYGETITATSYTWNNLSAGTTYTLKVKAIGDGTYYLDSDAKSGSGSTKAAQSGNNVYSLYSGTLTEGDYILVYSGKAMKNTVSSSRLTYSEVTISNNTITGPGEEIVWHIAPSGNYWTIYNAKIEKYAAGTRVKNQGTLLTSGTDDGSLWTVSGTETYDFLNKKNSEAAVNAHLRNNGTYGFACYAEGTGGALSLYKKN